MNIIIRIIAGIFLFFGIIGGISQNIQENDFSFLLNKFEQNQYLDGQSPFNGPITAKVQWIVDIGGWGTEAISANDGTIYLGRLNVKNGKIGHVFAINPDGTKKWTFGITKTPDQTCGSVPDNITEEYETICPMVESNVVSLAISSDGTIFAGLTLNEQGNLTKPRDYSQDRFIVAINPDGTEKWRLSIGPNNVTSRISIDSRDIMYFVTGTRDGDHDIYAVGSENGQIIWQKTYESENLNGPAIGPDGTLYFGGDKVMAIDSSNGNTLWEYNTKTAGAFPYGPAIGPDGTIYVPSVSDFNLHAIDANGNMKWKYNVGFAELIPAIGKDGTIYVHTWQDALGLTKNTPNVAPGLHALNPDGTIKWSRDNFFQLTEIQLADPGRKALGQTLGGSDSSIIIDANGILYFGSDIGTIYAVDSVDGKTLWEAKFLGEFDNRPIITPNNTLILCHHGGGGLLEGPRCIGMNDKGTILPSAGTLPQNSDLENQTLSDCFDYCIDVEGLLPQQCLAKCSSSEIYVPNTIPKQDDVKKTDKSNDEPNICMIKCLATGESNTECNQACN